MKFKKKSKCVQKSGKLLGIIEKIVVKLKVVNVFQFI